MTPSPAAGEGLDASFHRNENLNFIKVAHERCPLLFHVRVRANFISPLPTCEDEGRGDEGADGLGHGLFFALVAFYGLHKRFNSFVSPLTICFAQGLSLNLCKSSPIWDALVEELGCGIIK